MEIKYEFKFRIAYADTDRMGVVYYGNYFTLFERGRTELMREFGFRYRDLEDNEKVFLPVSETRAQYFAPAKYDEMINVITTVKELGRAHIDFEYVIMSEETGKKVAEGFTRHPFVNMNWKPVRIPASFRDKFNAR